MTRWRRFASVVVLPVTLLASAPQAQAQAQASGLDGRPSNTTCIAPARPAGAAGVTAQDAFPTVAPFAQPVKILQPPGDNSRWFVLEKAGVIKLLDAGSPPVVTTWLDMSSRVAVPAESGLLGLAFHPHYPATREIYVFYTAIGSPMKSIVARLIPDDAFAPSNVTEQVILTVNQSYPNHKGGDIAFGADGYLYIGLGDGGDSAQSQNTATLRGSMLRIDVLGVPADERYRIPPDNPFAGNPRCGPATNGQSCPEAYAWGSGIRGAGISMR